MLEVRPPAGGRVDPVGPGHGRLPVVRARLDDPHPGVPLVTYLPPFLVRSPATGLFYRVHARSAVTYLGDRRTHLTTHPLDDDLSFPAESVTPS